MKISKLQFRTFRQLQSMFCRASTSRSVLFAIFSSVLFIDSSLYANPVDWITKGQGNQGHQGQQSNNQSCNKTKLNKKWCWIINDFSEDKIHQDCDMVDINVIDAEPGLVKRIKKGNGKRKEEREVTCYINAVSMEKDAALDGTKDREIRKACHGGEVRDTNGPVWRGSDGKAERWCDVRKPVIRAAISKAIDEAGRKGCDYLEFDNVDIFENQDEAEIELNDRDILNFLKFLTDKTRATKSSVTRLPLKSLLKNSWATLKKHPTIADWFDGSLAEECCEYKQCENLKIFPDKCKPVFIAEYGHARPTDKDSPFRGNYMKNEDIKQCCTKAKNMNMNVLFAAKELNNSKYFTCTDESVFVSWNDDKMWSYVHEYCKNGSDFHDCKKAQKHVSAQKPKNRK